VRLVGLFTPKKHADANSALRDAWFVRSDDSFVRTDAVAANTVRFTVIPRACRVSTANERVFTDAASV